MIALYGGSFDPFHLGHAHLVKTFLKDYPVDSLYLVPTRQNPLKKDKTLASPTDRLQMTELALQELHEPKAQVLDWEISGDGPSYTVDTLEKARKTWKEPLVLLVGDEVAGNLDKWKEPEKILKLTSLVVACREKKRTSEWLTDLLTRCGAGPTPPRGASKRFHLEKSDTWAEIWSPLTLPYSASQLRREIATNSKNPSYVPQGVQRSVWLYIKENRLYTVTSEVP